MSSARPHVDKTQADRVVLKVPDGVPPKERPSAGGPGPATLNRRASRNGSAPAPAPHVDKTQADRGTLSSGEFASIMGAMQTLEQLTLGDFRSTITIDEATQFSQPAALVVADHTTARFCADSTVCSLTPGEEHKTMANVEHILSQALNQGLARDGSIVGLGGGVICDMAAFAASIYQRGCRLTLVPTTLLAMVDAAIGGKTGVNFGGFKNMVGSFFPAHEVRLLPALLGSLPEVEYRSGLAEVIKAGLLADADLVELLERESAAVLGRDPGILRILVERSVRVKVQYVQQDFREQGVRAHLNLGHTFAHALESVAGFGAWTHGEAVAWGMACALDLSVALDLARPDYCARVQRLLADYGFRTEIFGDNETVERLVQAMSRDKKKQAGQVRFIVQRGPQDTLMQPVDERLVRRAIRFRSSR